MADNTEMSRGTSRPGGRYLARAVAVCVLLVVIYYLVPVEPDLSGGARAVRAGFAVAAALALVLLIARMVGRLVREEPGVEPTNLLVALFGGVILFALVDFLIAISAPGQFEELETKTDALYFAVSTLATVGFGDVSARGQFARAVVTGQMLFNLVVLATAGSVLVNRLTTARRRPPADRD